MKNFNLLERMTSRKRDFIEIVNTYEESDLQYIIDFAVKNDGKIKSISSYNESHSTIEEVYNARDSIHDPSGHVNLTETFPKTNIYYRAFEKMNFQDKLNKKYKRIFEIAEKNRMEELRIEKELEIEEESYFFKLKSKESIPNELL